MSNLLIVLCAVLVGSIASDVDDELFNIHANTKRVHHILDAAAHKFKETIKNNFPQTVKTSDNADDAIDNCVNEKVQILKDIIQNLDFGYDKLTGHDTIIENTVKLIKSMESRIGTDLQSRVSLLYAIQILVSDNKFSTNELAGHLQVYFSTCNSDKSKL